jgi:hypothetical protein
MVSIAAFQAVDPGSIPGRRMFFFFFFLPLLSHLSKWGEKVASLP